MCRWIAYAGQPVYLEKLVTKPENSLIAQSLRAQEGKTETNGDGFGIGWYGSRETPVPQGHVFIRDRSGQIEVRPLEII